MPVPAPTPTRAAAPTAVDVATPATAGAPPEGPPDGAAPLPGQTPVGEAGSETKVTFGKAADAFLMVFVSKWIADKDDRAARVRTMKAILEAVRTEPDIDSSKWNEKTLACHLKKMAAKVRHAH